MHGGRLARKWVTAALTRAMWRKLKTKNRYGRIDMEQVEENFSLWKAVEKTSPEHTKQVKIGHDHTSLSGTYMLKKATEQWGPIGGKWWFEIMEERFDEGRAFAAPLPNGEYIHHVEKVHTIRLRLRSEERRVGKECR